MQNFRHVTDFLLAVNCAYIHRALIEYSRCHLSLHNAATTLSINTKRTFDGPVSEATFHYLFYTSKWTQWCDSQAGLVLHGRCYSSDTVVFRQSLAVSLKADRTTANNRLACSREDLGNYHGDAVHQNEIFKISTISQSWVTIGMSNDAVYQPFARNIVKYSPI